MATTGLDHKAATDRISNDDVVPTNVEAGHAPVQSSLVAPPLVAAMTLEQRIEAENKLRRKIDIRLLPMIILMYIMNYLGEHKHHKCLLQRMCSFDPAQTGTISRLFDWQDFKTS